MGNVAALSMDVLGNPKSQGSLRAILPRNATKPVIIDDNRKALRAWRRTVEVAAREAWTGPPIMGPVAVKLGFRVAQPQRPEWTFPAVKPDLDKLVRAVLDALTDARVWRDDAQVVQIHTTKVYAVGRVEPGVDLSIFLVQ